jgi:hypothetical protein
MAQFEARSAVSPAEAPREQNRPRWFARQLSRVWRVHRVDLYSVSLPLPKSARVTPAIPVEFRVNCPDTLELLARAGEELGMERGQAAQNKKRLRDGETCVSAWSNGQLAYYGWVQFRERQLARLTTVPIGPGRAFIYRAFTRERFRGHRIYPAALQFKCDWLAERSYRTVFVDHIVGNDASARGIRRAGFTPIGQYTVRRVVGLRWAAIDEELASRISK